MPRRMEIHWPDFDVTLTADLLDDENPKLCERLWQALPFETLPMHSMGAGKIFKVPIPITLRPTPEAKLGFMPDQPPGTILYCIGMGFFLIFGKPVVEPFTLLRIAMIPEKELEKLNSVVPELEDAFWFTKKVNKVIFRKQE